MATMMDGTDADGEWSDEEVVRSGSNTGVSETEQDDQHPVVTIKRPQSSLGILTSRTTYSFMTSDPLIQHTDPVTSILDRIDAEIEMIGETPTRPSHFEKNGGSKHRNGSSLKSRSNLKNGTHQVPSLVLHSADNAEDTDTGLGSTSLRGGEGSSTEKINGTAEIYSEACMTDGLTDDDVHRRTDNDVPSDLDSVTAHQIDTKFKEIMRKKKDDPDQVDCRYRPRRRRPQSEPRVTFLTPPPQFRDGSPTMPPDLPVHPGKPTASLSLTPRLRHHRTRPSATMLSTGYGTDNESIRTEDFETKFQNMMINSDTEKQPDNTSMKTENSTAGNRRKDEEKSKSFSKDTQPKSSYLLEPGPPVNNNNTDTDEDDIMKRLKSIAQGSSPSINHAPSSSPPVQSSIPRPRSLSPSRLSLRKHHTSDDINRLWRSSGSNSSQKNNWDDLFWGSSTSKGAQSYKSSESTFDEVESLNLSRSSNDSSQRVWDRKYTHGNKVAEGGGGGGEEGRRIGKSGGFGGGGVGGGRSGGRDLYKRHISRQSSTTSTSTSPSSINFGSSDASSSSNRDMALTKKLMEFIEEFSSQGNLGTADKVHLRKLAQQVADWDAANEDGPSVQSTKQRLGKNYFNSESNSSFSVRSEDYKNAEDVMGREKKYYGSEPPIIAGGAHKKRRKDLIIPDDEENNSDVNNHKKLNDEGDNRKTKDSSHSSIKKSPQDLSKDNSHNISQIASVSQDNGFYSGEMAQHLRLRMLMPSKSFNKSGSFESNASPTDPFNPFIHPFSPSHAERVLMGLGFGGKEGFLPERFLRDWYSKLSQAQAKEYQRVLSQVSKDKDKENEPEKPDNAKESEPSQPNHRVVNERPQVPAQPMRQDSVTSSQLDEAASFLPSHNGQDAKKRLITEFLSALSTNDNSDGEAREMRVKHFANSRQKSLPLFLETLSEEDEKSSRIPGVDPFDKEAKLQMFITDVMSNSGKSTGSNSGNSVISSVFSESESVSSSSDGQNLKLFSSKDISRDVAEKYFEQQKKWSTAVKDSGKTSLKGLADKDRQKPSLRSSTKSPGGKRKGARLVRQEKKSSSEKPLSGEKEVLFSTDSLEVADIMKEQKATLSNSSDQQSGGQTKSGKPMLKNVEPAMVSIVLEDVDEGKSDSNSKNELTRSESGHLSIPSSRCSSMSLSPIPQSPVTVIEVGLDNQQDSLDTEDGVSFVRDPEQQSLRSQSPCDFVSCEHCGNKMVLEVKSTSGGNESTSANICDSVHNNYFHFGELNNNKKHLETGAWTNSLEVPEINTRPAFKTSSERHQRNRKISMQDTEVRKTPSPVYSRKWSLDSTEASPLQSPSVYRNQNRDENTCYREEYNQSPKTSSTSLNSQSLLHDLRDCNEKHTQNRTESKQDLYTAQSHTHLREVSHDHNLRHNNVHCHKCSYHIHQNHNHHHTCCDYHHTEHHRHHHRCHYHKQHHYRCCDLSSMHYPSPTCEKAFSLSDIPGHQVSISAHSSPGSSKSAFKSPRKDTQTCFNTNCYLSERSDTDQGEFPSHVILDLNPRPISSTSKNIERHSCLVHNDQTNSLTSSSDLQSPTLLFSEETHLIPGNSGDKRGKVQQISRAVQAFLPNSSDRALASSLMGENYYLACDREIQCSIGDISTPSFPCFDKFTQTHIPSYEVSCQTHEHFWDEREDGSKLSALESDTKGTNTVICLIGDEHNNSSYDTLIADTSSVRTNNSDQFQFVDDTLDLIDIELNAIDSKIRGQEKVTSLRQSSSSPTQTRSQSSSTNASSNELHSPFTNNNILIFENRNWQKDVSASTPIPEQSAKSINDNDGCHINTNPFLNFSTTQSDGNPFTQDIAKRKTQLRSLGQTFDMDKEMSAYLRPCIGMYDEVRTPESFRSSPNDLYLSTSFTHGSPNTKNNFFESFPDGGSLEQKDSDSKKENQIFEITQSNLDLFNMYTESEKAQTESKNSGTLFHRETNVTDNGDEIMKSSPQPKPRTLRRDECMGKMKKVKSTSDIPPTMRKDFLQIPSSPEDWSCKARYPGTDPSSPSSCKSMPPTTALELQVPVMASSRRSCSLDDGRFFGQMRVADPIKAKKLRDISRIEHFEETNCDGGLKATLKKEPSFDQKSEHSEIPLSSPRDSFTEVSVLSSVEDPSRSPPTFDQSEQTQTETSVQSGRIDTAVSKDCGSFSGVELYLSCFDSSWDGLYACRGQNTLMEKLQRTSTNESGKSMYVHSMDALSDRSVAGSEAARDLDEIELLLSQPKAPRRESDSSYSDIQNHLTPSPSHTSLDSLEDEIDGDIRMNCLHVPDDGSDLLLVSPSSVLSPSSVEMGPRYSKGVIDKIDPIDMDLNMIEHISDKHLSNDYDKGLIQNANNNKAMVNEDKWSRINEKSNETFIVATEKLATEMYNQCQDERNNDKAMIDRDDGKLEKRKSDRPSQNFKVASLDESNITKPDVDPISSLLDVDVGTDISSKEHSFKSFRKMKSDPADKIHAWWSRNKSKEKSLSKETSPIEEDVFFQEPPKEESGNVKVDTEKEDLLVTFQNAQFDSLLNRSANDDGTPFSSDTSFWLETSGKPSEFEETNAHVLSVETEEKSETNDLMVCSAKDCNIMDELEIIALFKNMENMSERCSGDFGTKASSPYPLSEIPEEDTQSEESVNIDRQVSRRNVRSQETQESIIESALVSETPDFSKLFKTEHTGQVDNQTVEPSSQIQKTVAKNKGSGKHLDLFSHQNDPSHDKLTSFVVESSPGASSCHTEVQTSSEPWTDCLHSVIDCSSTQKVDLPENVTSPILERTIFKEEHNINAGLVYECSLNSNISQRTVLNIYSPKTSSPKKNASVVLKDYGHLSTVNFSVPDYREFKSDINKDRVEDEKNKSSTSQRVAVTTMFSQSRDDDTSSLCVKTKKYYTIARKLDSEATQGKLTSPAGKRLRSRESLLRLHDQERVSSSSAGSDSDSDLTNALRTNGDFDIRERDLALGRIASDATDDDFKASTFISEFSMMTNGVTSPKTPKENNMATVSTTPSPTSIGRPQLSITRGVIYPQDPTPARDVVRIKPRVIVQQPSDEILSSEHLWASLSASSNIPDSSGSQANLNDHHLHSGTSTLSPPNDNQVEVDQDTRHWSLPKRTPSGLWTRRTRRPNFLSPNLALLNDTFKEPSCPFRRDYTSSNDDSHPELAYLDLIPKFKGEKDPSENRLTVPVTSKAKDRTNPVPEPKSLAGSKTQSGFRDTDDRDRNGIKGKGNTTEPKSLAGSKIDTDVKNTDDHDRNRMKNKNNASIRNCVGKSSTVFKDSEDYIGFSSKQHEINSKQIDAKTALLIGSNAIDSRSNYSNTLSFQTIDRMENKDDRSNENQFVGTGACEALIVQTNVGEPVMTSSCDESPKSDVMLVTSRDSGFESNGSPIESVTSKETNL